LRRPMRSLFVALFTLVALTSSWGQECNLYMGEGVRFFYSGFKDKMVIAVHGGLSSAQKAYEFCLKASNVVPEDYGVASLDFSPSPLGKQEVSEAVLLAKLLKEKGAKEIGLLGESHGAYIALMASLYIKPSFVVDVAGMTDLSQMYRYFRGHPEVFKGWEATVNATKAACESANKTEQECLLELSPSTYAGFVQWPVLIIHGTRDRIIPPPQSLQFAEKLFMFKNTEVWLYLFPSGHEVDFTREPVKTLIREFIKSGGGNGLPEGHPDQKEHKALPAKTGAEGNRTEDSGSGALGAVGEKQPAVEIRGDNGTGNQGEAGPANGLGKDNKGSPGGNSSLP